HRRRWLAEVVPDRRVGDIGAAAVEGAEGAFAAPALDRLRLRRGDGREQDVVVGEDRVDALGYRGLAPQRAPKHAATQPPPDRRHAPRARLKTLGMIELRRLLREPGQVWRHDVGQKLPVLWVALGDLVAERAQELRGLLGRPARLRAGLHTRKRPLQ